MFIADKKIKTN